MNVIQRKSGVWFAALLLAVMIIGGSLNNAPGDIRLAGYMTIGGLLYTANIYLLVRLLRNQTFQRRYLLSLGFALLLLVSYGVGVLLSLSMPSVIMWGQVAMLVGFFVATSFMTWNRAVLSPIALVVSAFLLLMLVHWLWSGAGYRFSSYLTNENVFGGFVFAISFFVWYRKNAYGKYIMIAIVGLLLIVSGARAVWVAAFATLFTFVMWEPISANRKRFFMYFVATLGLLFVVVYMYSHHFLIPELSTLNRTVFLYTGQNLFSGRENFWWILVELILENPILGHGADAMPSKFLTTDLSSHNLFIQTALQVGLLGLSILIGLLFSIWKLLWTARRDPLVKLAGAFFMGMLVHQTFEVSLTQVNLATGLIYWLILGIGVSRAVRHPQESYVTPEWKKFA